VTPVEKVSTIALNEFPAERHLRKIPISAPIGITRRLFMVHGRVDSFLENTPMKLLSRCVVFTLIFGIAAWSLSGALAGEQKVKVGDKVPSFKSVDENGKAWKSTDVVGKKILVLYFYPADFTGGCTAQACGFRDDVEKLGSQGVEVVGVSGDSVKTHQMFKEHHKLNFTLLADEKGALAKVFGVPVKKGGKSPAIDASGSKVDMDRGVTIMRYTVVIDKNGTVAAIDEVKNAGGDAKRIADFVKKLDTK
jgi:peroxiredoxin Q/BCP